jgi:hypothetical protein
MSIMLVAGEQKIEGAERVDPTLRPLLDHIAAELAQEYIRLMEAAAVKSPRPVTQSQTLDGGRHGWRDLCPVQLGESTAREHR